jgi:hypothetical protein
VGTLLNAAAIFHFRQALLQLNAIHNLSPSHPQLKPVPRIFTLCSSIFALCSLLFAFYSLLLTFYLCSLLFATRLFVL